MKVHVITHKEALRTEELSDKVVVVFDVLLATTTIVASLHYGAEAVIPVMDEQEARDQAVKHEDELLMAGEWNGRTLDGFLDPSPFILKDRIKGKTLILSSTNGTRAIRLASSAKKLYIGSLLNSSALTDWLVQNHQDDTILLVCSGSSGRLSLEDFFGAGVFAFKIKTKLPGVDFTDAATVAAHFADSKTGKASSLLKESRVGKLMVQYGMEREVVLASQIGGYPEIPVLDGDHVIKNAEGELLT